MINDAEGTYNHEKKAVLLAIITREEYTDFKHYMRKADPKPLSPSQKMYIF